MAVIRKEDVISSVADALQYISYYHPLDFVQALDKAYQKEESQAAKDAIAQILINSRMSAEGHRPICQDTGIVTCFVNIGMNVQWDSDLTVQEMIDEGVRQGYTNQTTHFVHRFLKTRRVSASTPKTIRQPLCTSTWCQAIRSKSKLQRKAAAPKTKPRWSCLIHQMTLLNG